ncbi:MAG: DUF5723 family protein, partial [Saprospiraceae bacterium]
LKDHSGYWIDMRWASKWVLKSNTEKIKMHRNYIIIFALVFLKSIVLAQDISLLHLRGHMPGIFLNPGLKLDKKFNLSLGAIDANIGTDGPSIDEMTSKNAAGKRIIDIQKLNDGLDPHHNIWVGTNIQTISMSFNLGGWVLMGGHGHRTTANIKYPKGLIEIASQGNAAFVGQNVQIGPSIDLLSYNELCLGLQKTQGKFTVGAKGKLLFGTAGATTERSDITILTDDEYYQLTLTNNYTIRSSSFLKYNSLDSITADLPTFTFDNLFYNNRGFAFDLGVSFQITDDLTLSASALDIGSIDWDFTPRKYISNGTFVFEGLDIQDFIDGNSEEIFKDSLLGLIKVQSSLENFNTPLNPTFSLGASYQLGKTWTFHGLYMRRSNFEDIRNTLSLMAVARIGILDIGAQYHLAKNNYASLGLFSNLKLGPVGLYLASDNIGAIIQPLTQKNISLRLGATLRL